MTGDRPKEWGKRLPLAEWWFNTNFHTSTKVTPFEVIYCTTAPTYSPYVPGESNVATVDNSLRERDRIIRLLKENLQKSQHRMKQVADAKRTERTFKVGDFVYLRLQPFRQTSLAWRENKKLAPKFFGPFPVLEWVGQVAYRLQLPVASSIHPVFHVSCLKKKIGEQVTVQTELPPVDDAGRMKLEPLAVLDRRLVKRNNRAVTQVLIHWTNSFLEDATWEYWQDMEQRFPAFQP